MPDLRGNITALRHSMLDAGDTLQGEFCDILNLGETFDPLAVCGASFKAFSADSFGYIKALVKGSGAITLTRATEATYIDGEGILRTAGAQELRCAFGRTVKNLAAGTAAPVTQNITVVSGHAYQVSIGPASEDGAEAVCSSAFVGTLTSDGENQMAFQTAKTATGTTLTITISGGIKDLAVTDVTWQSNQNPPKYVSVGVESGQYHGAMIDGVGLLDHENGNVVDGLGRVSLAQGAALPDWRIMCEPPATNYVANCDFEIAGGGGADVFGHWVETTAGASTVNNETTDVPAGFSNACRFDVDASQSNLQIQTQADYLPVSAGVDSIALSFWVKSPAPGGLKLSIRSYDASKTTLEFYNGTGWQSAAIEFNPGNLPSSWERWTKILPPVSAGQTTVRLFYINRGSGLASNSVFFTGFDLIKAGQIHSHIKTGAVPATRTADDWTGGFDFSNWSQIEGTWHADAWFSSVGGSSQNLLSVKAGTESVLYEAAGDALSTDSADTSRTDGAVISAPDNRYRLVVDFKTGETLEVAGRDVDGAGAFAWDSTPASFSGSFTTNNVFSALLDLTSPVYIRDMSGYHTRKGKLWVEASL